MLALCFVVAVAAVHATVAAPDSHASIFTLTAEVEVLEGRKAALFEELTIAINAVDSAEEVVQRFNIKSFPRIKQKMKNAQVELDRAVVKKNFLQMAVDDLTSEGLENEILAINNADEVSDLQNRISSLLNVDGNQASNVSDIQASMTTFASDTESTLARIDTANMAFLMFFQADIGIADGIQDNRYCEDGLLTATIPGNASTTFFTAFSRVPRIVTSVVGFKAHLVDVYGYDTSSSDYSYTDLLCFNVTVSSSSPGGFGLDVTVTQDTAVRPEQVYIRFSACENLDIDLSPA